MSNLSVTIIQTDLHWENKAANLQMLEEKINSIKEKTEIVVLPEMFTTGFSMKPELLAETMEGETVQWMKRMAAEKKIILTGSVIIEEGRGIILTVLSGCCPTDNMECMTNATVLLMQEKMIIIPPEQKD